MLTLARSTAFASAAMFMVFGTTACATKKFVRQTVSPVEARVSTTEKKTSDNASAIGELENNLSRTDERASEANRNATAAGQAAERANQAALEARNRADTAATAAERASSRLGEVVSNIDNYQLVSTEAILFPVNKATLTKDAKEQLDQAVANITNNKNFVLEIQGFTDKTGSRDANLALSQRRADAVVRYLTVNHQVPLRKIHVLGLGAENFAADNKSRAGRKQNRRVEVKVYALNLDGQQAQGSMTSGTMNQQGTTGTPGTTGTTGQMTDDQARSRTETARP